MSARFRGLRSTSGRVRGGRAVTSPFAVLGLDQEASLTDDDVRAAWRRVAAATHPDRADGGDPARFALAAAAYTELRTVSGRGEARAALKETRRADVTRLGSGLRRLAFGGRLFGGRLFGGRLFDGRPGRLVLRTAIAAGASAAALAAAGPGPAGPALVTGAATWLVLTARHDLGPRRR